MIFSYTIEQGYFNFTALYAHYHNWRKLAEILVTINVSLNAIFCIIITGAIIIGLLMLPGFKAI